MALDVPLNCAFFRLLHLTPTHRCRPGLHWPALLHPGKGKQSRGVSHDTTLRLSPTLGKVSHPLLPPLTLGLPAFKTTNFSALSAISTSAPGQTSRDRSQSLHAASRTDPSLIPKSISTMAGRPRRGAPHTCSWRLGLGRYTPGPRLPPGTQRTHHSKLGHPSTSSFRAPRLPSKHKQFSQAQLSFSPDWCSHIAAVGFEIPPTLHPLCGSAQVAELLAIHAGLHLLHTLQLRGTVYSDCLGATKRSRVHDSSPSAGPIYPTRSPSNRSKDTRSAATPLSPPGLDNNG